MNRESLMDWLERTGDWLVAMVVIAVFTSTAIGLRERATGGALFVSNITAGLIGVAAYPFLEQWGYGGPYVFVAGLLAGACGISVFGILIALRDVIARRRERIAGQLVDRVAPGTGETHGP